MFARCMVVVGVGLINLFALSSEVQGISCAELAAICQSAEEAIADLYIEYEWLTIPPYSPEGPEVNDLTASGVVPFLNEAGVRVNKLSVSRIDGGWSRLNAQDLNQPFDYPFLREERLRVVDVRTREKREHIINQSYDGRISKTLQRHEVVRSDGNIKPSTTGVISEKRTGNIIWETTPLAFSVLRPALRPIWNYKPLSSILKFGDFVRVDEDVTRVNDFNTVRVSFLDPCEPHLARVYMRTYFSVDHNYTPVRFEHMAGRVDGPDRVALAVEVHSLEKIGPDLWFPSRGLIVVPRDSHSDGFQTISPIRVNQGLTASDFDIVLPSGTKVWDARTQKEYIAGSP